MKKIKRIVVGNWKMNPIDAEKAKEIVKGIQSAAQKVKNVSAVICPPFVYLEEAVKYISKSKAKSSISIGAQDVFWEAFEGSFTGEVSPVMLKNAGVKYIIVGHSERRELGENDEMVAKKVAAVLKEDLIAILCVGEKERDENGTYFEFLRQQIRASLAKTQKRYVGNLIIAYEPIWAIGKSEYEAMKSKDVHQMVIFIKRILTDMYGAEEAAQVPILYGGSVSPRNTLDIVGGGEVQGLLVGRQSLDPESFSEILKIVGEVK